jgi:hypothetical protein
MMFSRAGLMTKSLSRVAFSEARATKARAILSFPTRIVRRSKSATATSSKATSDAKTNATFQETFKDFMNKPRDMFSYELSLSQLVGRSAYLFSIAAFAEADILDLRMFALLSSSLSLSFQWLARPAPQKYPLFWGAFLMGINAYMATTLCIERKQAEYMGEEFEAIYEAGDFANRGFGRVEFFKFFNSNADCCPTKRQIKEDGVLVAEDTVNTKLYYIVEGTAEVCHKKSENEKDFVHLATVEANGFIGELSMLDVLDPACLSIEKPSASVVAGKGGVTVYEWELLQLRYFMWNNRSVSNALQTYACHDLRDKMRKNTDKMKERKLERGTTCLCC